MAVTLTREPGAAVFSRNPVVFAFHTDRRYANAGRPFVGNLQFLEQLTEGAVLTLRFGGTDYPFVFRNNPDDSGLQLPAAQTGGPMEDWVTDVLGALNRNYYVDRNYELWQENSDTIRFTGRMNTDEMDLSLTDGGGVSMSVLQSGAPAILTANLKVLAELHVMRLDGTGFDVYSRAALEPDDNGDTEWDVSAALTTALLAEGRDRPSLLLPVFEVSRKTARRFFVRYAEMFGQPQRVRKTTVTAVKWGVYGGFSKGMLAERAFPGWFVAAGKLKWMDQSNGYRTVKLDQPDYLYTVNFLGMAMADVAVRVKVFFSDNTDLIYTAHTFDAVPVFGRMIVPAGMKQLGVHLLDDEKVAAGYEVWLEGGAGAISDVMRFTVNYRYEPYTRFFVYENSFGAYEGVYVYGRKSKSYEVVQESAVMSRMTDFRLEDGERLDFDVHLTDSEEVNTGYMTRRQVRGFRDFFLSTDRYAYKNGRYYPITLLSTTVEEFQDGNNLFALAFEVGSRYSEELFTADEETDEYGYTPDLSGYIPPPPADPENFDDRYYLKIQTYNRAEIDAKITAVQLGLVQLANGVDVDTEALWLAVNGKAPANHTHPQYVTAGDLFEAVDDTWIFRGDWVQPEPDEEDAEVYSTGNYVIHTGALWKSTADENVSEPGTSGATWLLVLRAPMALRNDALEFSTTSVQLTGLYGDFKVGDMVWSETAGLVWTKLDDGNWNKSNRDKA